MPRARFSINYFSLRLGILLCLILTTLFFLFYTSNFFQEQVPNSIPKNNRILISGEKLQSSGNRAEPILIKNREYSGQIDWFSVPDYNLNYYLKLESTEINTKNLSPAHSEINIINSEFKIRFEKTGKYKLILCSKNQTKFNCSENNPRLELVVIPNQLQELVDGHNSPSNKANLIFTGDKLFTDPIQFSDYVKRILSYNGQPIALDKSGAITELSQNNSNIDELIYGPFSIEPLKSNLSKFNFWYLPEPIIGLTPKEVIELGQKTNFWQGFSPSKGTKFSVIYLNNGDIDYSTFATLSGSINPDPDFNFGHTILRASPSNNRSGFYLAHELGHSIFGLYDEYGLQTNQPATGFPNCASSLSQASLWWGDKEGQVDPFFQQWKSDIKKYGLDYKSTTTEDQIKTSFVYGGCGAQYRSTNTVRPTENSIMDDTTKVPVWGSVNRQRVEQILLLLN
ncbi:MAG: hypothetical protein OHK0017_06110 [Patescibacteria group bacterium]